MASWSDVRLLVLGNRAEVAEFGRCARRNPASIFRHDMLVGEWQKLSHEGIQRVGDGLYRKRFYFQARNDDGQEYFTDLSLKFPSLCFVLTWDYSGDDEIGGCRIQNGRRAKTHLLSRKYMDSVMRERGIDFEADWEDPEDDNWWTFCEVRNELLDECEEWWLQRILSRR